MKQIDEIHSESVLLVYFVKKAKHLKASILPHFVSCYSMIKASLEVKHNVDISKYSRLSFLKKQNLGSQPQKFKILSTEQIDRFPKEAPKKKFLMAKVAMIMDIAGALRSDEVGNLLSMISRI